MIITRQGGCTVILRLYYTPDRGRKSEGGRRWRWKGGGGVGRGESEEAEAESEVEEGKGADDNEKGESR